jgi:hypothetical protein
MLIGIELEGWAETHAELYEIKSSLITPNGWELKSDGSIHPEGGVAYSTFEVTNKPFKRTELDAYFQKMERFYPLIHHNESCGLHVHLSFENMKNYYLLLDWKFVEKFMHDWKDTFKSELEQKRINNTYCKFYNDEDAFKKDTLVQIFNTNTRPSERYRCVNFHCFKRLKTVEFRMFPMAKTFEDFKRYITWLTDYVAKYCNRKSVKDSLSTKAICRITKQPEIIDLNTYVYNKSQPIPVGHDEDGEPDDEPDEDRYSEYEE